MIHTETMLSGTNQNAGITSYFKMSIIKQENVLFHLIILYPLQDFLTTSGQPSCCSSVPLYPVLVHSIWPTFYLLFFMTFVWFVLQHTV